MFPGKSESVNFEGDISFASSQRLTTREKKQARDNLGINKDNLVSSIMNLVNIRAEEIYYENLPINPNTIRFSFSKSDYNPTTDRTGLYTATWTKLDTKYTNIWEWHCEHTTWFGEFADPTATPTGRGFRNPDNLVKILSINFGTITDIRSLFSGCWSITDVPKNIDFSDIEKCTALFQDCENLTKVYEWSFPKAESARNMFNFCLSLQSLPVMHFEVATDFKYYAMHCENMKVFEGLDAPNATDFRDLLEADFALEQVVSLGDTSKVQIWHDCFDGCYNLTQLPATIDMSAATDCYGVFGYCRSLENLPEITWGNNVTTLENFLKCCSRITEIPDMAPFHYVTNFKSFMSADDAFESGSVPKSKPPVPMAIKVLPSWYPQQATNVEDMFYGCKNVEDGIYGLYLMLSNKITPVTNHKTCFELCGVDTEEGRKQLDLVPDDWK